MQDSALPEDSSRKFSLEKTLKLTKLRLLLMHFESKVGHIGGNLSCLDMLVVLYHRIITKDDQFILSKGHSAGALYATLWSLGRIKEQELSHFHRDNTRLSAHPPPTGIDDILFATGSLGHGLSLAAGLAMSKKLLNQSGRVYCLMSDGEWNEGSCWEALIFAKQQQLDNLTVLIDLNGLQGFGTTQEVADLSPLEEKFKCFGIDVVEVDGHDLNVLEKTLSKIQRLTFVVARTIKGKGVSFMENRVEWHYLPLSEEQYHRAVREIQSL